MTTATRLSPKDVLDALSRHILVDGYHVVMDMEQSRGSYLFDARSGRPLLDFFTNFATMPIGYNHPKMADPEMRERLLQAALTKPTNSDIYTADYAEFVETFARLAIPASHAGHLFFVEGGALGVENALKTAFDWKVRKNFARGLKEETGKQILHFRNVDGRPAVPRQWPRQRCCRVRLDCGHHRRAAARPAREPATGDRSRL